MAHQRQAADFTLKALRERCKDIESHVDARKLARPEERKDRRPGGKDNPGGGYWSWVRWYGALCAFLDREDRGFPDEQDPDAVVLDALRGEPVEVKLVEPVEGVGASVKVYPKSLDALLNLHARDWLLGWLSDRMWFLKQRGKADDAKFVERCTTELSYQHALCIWTVTTPGAGMPFDPRSEKPEPPAWIAKLNPFDVVRIIKGHGVANTARLTALDALLSRQAGEKAQRPSWSIFISRMSKQLKIAPSSLMRDYDLASLSAAAYLGTPEAPTGDGGGDFDMAEALDQEA